MAPQNEIEQTIARVWQEVLEIEKVGVNQRFFDIGGDSLSIAKVYGKLQKILPNEIGSISLIDLFNYSTIATLARHLSQGANFPLQQNIELEQELTTGKNRLKQRLQKAANI